MKARKVFLVLFVALAVLSSSFVSASGQTGVPAGQTAIVRVYYPDLATGNQVLLAFEPQLLETNYEEGYHVMQVTQQELDRLVALGLRVVPDPTWVAPPVLASLPAGITSIPGYTCYRTVEETLAAAQALVAAHPDLATWIDAGNSWQKNQGSGGYDMGVLKLTNSAIPGPKPKLFLTAAIHAREYATAELVTRFGEYLVNNYGVDADVTWILDHHEVHLMLQTNPDGRKKAETGLSWRKNTDNNYCANSNSRGADLNRNFAFKWGCCGGSSGSPCNETYRGPSAGSEPETQAVQAYMASIFPDQRGPNDTDPAPNDATGVYIDVHSYGKLVLWPWGWKSGAAPNSTQLQTLGRKFAYFNGHSPEQSYSLYATDGTTDDHAYGTLGVASYCFETGTAFFQSCSYFESTLLPANLPALLYAAKVVRTPYMTPAGPDALSLAASANSVPRGTPVTLTASISDTRYNNSNGAEPTQAIAAAEYYVDTPPWQSGATAYAMAASDGGFNSSTEGVTASVDTAPLSNGKHLLFVRGKDASGNWGAFSAIFLTVVNSNNQPPTANPQSVVTAEDTALGITLTGSDPDGDPLTFSVTTAPGHGTLSGTAPNVTYAPAANYNGADSFAFVVNDGLANSSPATVSIAITPLNDAPVANPQSVTTQQDTAVAITLTGSDADGDPLTYSVATQPAHGSLAGTAPSLTYTPATGYTGSDNFTFTVSDGALSSTAATVSITVNAPGPVTVFSDDFETNKGWTRNPNGTDTATLGLWERANPADTNSSGPKQLGTTVSGSYDLVTGPLAGSGAGDYDVDGGVTTIRSPNIALPSGKTLTLTFKYYLAHLNNSSSADYFRVKVVGSTTTTVLQELGAANDDDAAWASFSGSLNSFAGQTVYLLIEAADASGASLVEAAVDDVAIVAQ
jgi:carboxypeptidase T